MSKQREWQHEFNLAKFLLRASDSELTWSDADYEAFKFRRGDVQILFYPHRTSASNYHIRVRDHGSKNEPLAQRIMDLLSCSTGECTFSQKNNHPASWYNSDIVTKWSGNAFGLMNANLIDDAARGRWSKG